MSLQLLEFEAEWCGPCDQQKDILEDYHLTDVRTIDVDENIDMANQYGVRSIPTLVLIDEDGNVVERWVGVTQRDVIEEVVSKNV